MDTIRVRKKRVAQECMTAFWENVWCSYEFRWLKWISGRDGCQSKEWLLIQLKNIEQDIREISMI
jgi:hypothetical protein